MSSNGIDEKAKGLRAQAAECEYLTRETKTARKKIAAAGVNMRARIQRAIVTTAKAIQEKRGEPDSGLADRYGRLMTSRHQCDRVLGDEGV